MPRSILIFIALAIALWLFLMYVAANAFELISSEAFTFEPHEALITDGDSLRIGETRIRLYGIDAPEKGQENGQIATDALANQVATAGRLTCRIYEQDKYGREIARCFDIFGRDLAKALVRLGLAFAYVEYSKDYISDQEFAEKHRLGFWGDDNLEMPWDYRRRRLRN